MGGSAAFSEPPWRDHKGGCAEALTGVRVEATIPFRWQSARSRSEEVVAKNRPGIARGAVTGTTIGDFPITRRKAGAQVAPAKRLVRGQLPAPPLTVSKNRSRQSSVSCWIRPERAM